MDSSEPSRQLLAEVIEFVEDGAAVFDSEDRLVQFNEKYTQNFSIVRDILKPGLSFREMLQALARRGLYDGPESGIEDWVAQRVNLFDKGAKANEIQHADGSWLRIDYFKLESGGTLAVAADVTAHRQGERTLREKHRDLEQMFAERTADLHAANDSLKAAQVQLTDAIESINDGFVYYDRQNRLVFCNKKYREFYPWIDDVLIPGAKLEDVARTAAERGQDAEEITDVDRWVQDRLETFSTKQEPHEQHLRDGRWLFCRESRTSDGGFVGIRTDITEMKATDAALREHETMLHAVIANVPLSLSLKDREGRFTLVNPGFVRQHGISAAEVLGKTFFDILPHEIAEDAAAEDRQVMESGEALRTDYSWPSHLGEQYELIFKFPLRPHDNGPISGVGVIALDVTEQKLGEIELRKSEERLTQAVQLAKLGHCIWDTKEDRCIFCSEEYARVHGLSPEDYIARARTPDGRLNHPDDRDTYRAAIRTLRQGDGFELEYRIVWPDGELRHVREIAKPLFDAGGSVVQEIYTIQDVTTIKATESQLVQARKMEAVGQLTGGVAHDFNNLLAVIVGNAELLQDQMGLGDNSLAAILRAATRGAELTQRLLAFSRRQPLKPRAVDLGALESEMGDLLRRTLGETITVEIRSDPDLWHAQVDPGQLENAILNLALNARDAMQKGGRLRIESTNVTLDQTYAASQIDVSSGDFVRITVSDSGAGMSAAVQAQAVEPFFTTKEVGKGSGLGLPMVYGFAKQSEGDLVIHSEEGLGTTIELYLPRAVDSVERAESSMTTEVPRGQGETVLVVEDEDEVRTLAEAILGSLGYRVLSAKDGPEGLKILDGEPKVDLLLSDVVLPGGMSGPDLANEAMRRVAGIRILFMSGYAESMIHQHSPFPGGADLLGKPFRKLEIAQTVRATLDR